MGLSAAKVLYVVYAIIMQCIDLGDIFLNPRRARMSFMETALVFTAHTAFAATTLWLIQTEVAQNGRKLALFFLVTLFHFGIIVAHLHAPDSAQIAVGSAAIVLAVACREAPVKWGDN